MADIQLLLTEVTDDHIKIGGIGSPTEDMKKVARCFNASKDPIYVDVDKVESLLDDAITKAAASGEVKDDVLTFKQPVIIAKKQEKSASARIDPESLDFVIGAGNAPAVCVKGMKELAAALTVCSSESLEKVATNQFTEDLIEAIHDAQIGSDGVMKLSMPIKLEFRDEASKRAFLGVGRRKKAKSEKLASAVKSVYRRQLIDMAVARLVK